jgi:RHS repeat-associated protein
MKGQNVSEALSHMGLFFSRKRFGQYRFSRIQPVTLRKDSISRLLKIFSFLFGIFCFTPVVQADVTITYHYDEAASTNGIGRLTSVTDTSGSSRIYYNNMGGVSRTDKVVDGTTYTTQTGYDILGRVSSITYPDNSVVNYAYTGSALDRVYEGSTNYAQYSGYNALGKPATMTTGNGVIATYTYSNTANGTCPQQNFRTCTVAIGNFQTLTYGYDNNQAGVGNVTSVANTANGNQAFVYDDLYRLTSATGPYGTLTYAYDQIGNMICNSQISSCSQASPNYTYPPSGAGSALPHAVTTAGTNSYSYDLNGNMLQGAGRTMTYDLQNRPTRIIAAGGTTNFVYDGGGGRVKKIVGSTTTLYIGKLYECANGSCSKHIFAGGQRVALKPVGSAEIYYYHSDHLGSSSVVTNASGAKVQDLAYYPYGQTRINTGTVDVHHKYTSQELDDSTGLYFYNARYYDPVLGRFIQADTIIPNGADPQAFNRYSYVRNNPINLVDPSGHRWGTLDRIMDRGRRVVHNTADAVRENERVQVAVGVGLQVFGGPMGMAGGSVLLSQSNAGRNILAGEIIVGTAVATFYCGGCGAAAGALVGELVGGYSAHRAGGNILSGVVVGGAVGAATGYLSANINLFPTFANATGFQGTAINVINGALNGSIRGAITGVGLGGTAGFAGGAGNSQSIMNGIRLGAAGGAITGGILGGVEASGVLNKSLYYQGGLEPSQQAKEAARFTLASSGSDLSISEAAKGLFGVGTPPPGATTIIPNIHQFAFETLPPIVPYGIGAGYGAYSIEEGKIPNISFSKEVEF